VSPCVDSGCPSKGAERCQAHEREFREQQPRDSRRQVTEPDRESLLMRERLADDRERRADDRDDRADARDAASADREVEVQAILAAAQQRDHRADARDHAANRRDVAEALELAVFGTNGTKPAEARRLAAKDRGHSKTDRSAAHIDRFLLSGAEPVTAEESEDDSAAAE
jgi:hypothetical protein